MPSKIHRNRHQGKPSKPYPDFPLTANGNGQWSKKIRGKVHCFGKWDDPDGALNRYLEVKDDLLAGKAQTRIEERTHQERPIRFGRHTDRDFSVADLRRPGGGREP